MKIREKLTLQFVLIVATILLLSLSSIYFFSSRYRKTQFENRLIERANTTARLLIDVDEVDSTLLKIIDNNNPGALVNENIGVFNEQMFLLYCNNDSLAFHVDKVLFYEVMSQKLITTRQNEFEIVGLEFKGKKKNSIVFAGAVDKYGESKLRNLFFILLLVFVFGIIIVMFAGWVYAGRALFPIKKMITQTQDISAKNIHQRISEGKNADELAFLASTINSLLDRLQSAIKSQQHFVANASHELRTPLTAMRGQIEIALRKSRDSDYLINRMDVVLADLNRVIMTLNQLLALTHASADETEIVFAKTDLVDLILQSHDDLTTRRSDYTINLNFPDCFPEYKNIEVFANELLLKTVFVNLMENACKYSSDKRVDVTFALTAGSIRINFTDHGSGIDAEDMGCIFEPFFRGKNSRNIAGSGIGLSVVEKIVQVHKGMIEVTSEVNKGSTFTVVLPKY